MSEGTERRTLSEAQSGLRVDAQTEETRKIVGYAAVFFDESRASETEYELWPGGPIERVMPGAFSRAIREDDVLGLVHHDPTKVLGRTSPDPNQGTLRLFEDRIGLRFEIDPPNTQLGRDMLESVARRDYRGASFGFRKPDQEFRKEEGRTIREVTGVGTLTDVSLTTTPAYSGTDAGVRADEDLGEVRSKDDDWNAAQDAAGDAEAQQELAGKLAGVKARARACEVEAGTQETS
jgi:HK97 family phage prohead protease